MNPVLQLDQVSKSFDGTPVLKEVSISIQKGEFITFLGPSGCGKTTMLRMIAGLEQPDSGRIFLNGVDVTFVQPNHRDVNTVFQSYALFPHKNVFQNIAYSLKLKRVAKDEIAVRVKEMLELVKLTGYEKRMPSQLSGGQRQRVAIARSLINRPQVLLLDEPLGALDLQLRRQMQVELKRLQKQLQTTFVYITHDQEEAINMSDRIVIMHQCGLEQIGPPQEIYDHPKTAFAAQFIGASNLLQGVVEGSSGGTAVIALPNGRVLADESAPMEPGRPVTLSVRSENLLVSSTPVEGFTLAAQVVENRFAGGTLRLLLRLANGQELSAIRTGSQSQLETGSRVFVYWDPAHAAVVEGEPL